MKEWVLQDGILCLANGPDIECPKAMDIYRSVVKSAPEQDDLPPGKHGAASGLEFSAYPATLTASLQDASEGGLPFISFEIETQRGKRFEVSRRALDAGHVVADYTWYAISSDSLADIREVLAEAATDHESGRVASLRGMLAFKYRTEGSDLVSDNTVSGAGEAIRLATKVAGQPVGINARLYPYQHDGWRWLRFVCGEQLGGLLADEMGLGKTLQVIATLSDPGAGVSLTPTLVVAPGSLLENWRREIEKFAPSLQVLKHQGSLRTGRPVELEELDVVIASYDTVVRDLSMMMMVEWGMVVLDEAQNIKNPDALRAKAVKSLKRHVGLGMTGTPVENRLSDLWSIMDFAVPGYLGDLHTFNGTFSDDPDGGAKLEPMITPLMLRRTVAEVATDLPDRIDIPEVLELSEEEAQAYEKLRQDILAEHGKAGTLVSIAVLRQFCADPAIIKRDVDLSGTAEFSKFGRLREILSEIAATGEKCIVFTSYTEMADRIARLVQDELGLFVATLDGRLPIDDRQPLIDRFSSLEDSAVLVLNPKAGGTGLNITAANHVIHYNLEWNPAQEDQASARAHRRGQDRPVTIRRLFCAGTVEEVVDERVARKRDLSQAAVVGVEGSEDDFKDVIAALDRSPLQEG